MIVKWLTTTAVALVIGTGAAIAQSPDTQQKRDEGSRAQTQSKDAERPAAGERSGDRSKGHAEQTDQKAGTKESQRGESGAGERSKQAQEPSRDAKERQSQEQTRDRPSATQHSQDEQKGREGSTQHTQDEQKGRDAKQATESKQQPGQNRAEEKKSGEPKQQQGQREEERNRNQQANQPSGSSTSTQQQSGRETPPDQRQGQQQTGPARDQSAERSGSTRLSINENQRQEFVDRMRQDRSAVSQNVNVRVDIGARLPRDIHARALPADLVRIAPQYRDYEYTVIDDRVAIVDPRTYEVVDVLDEGGGGGGRFASGSSYGRERISFSGDERRILKEHARSTVGSTSSISSTSSSGSSGPTCLSLQAVPEELARKHPELSGYKYLAIGDEAVLVDQQQKIVQVID